MTTPFQKLEAIFHGASELRGDEREAYLNDACDGDAALRARVVQMLLEDDSGTRGVLASHPAGPAERMAQRLGEFKIVGLLGEGGMGQVYEARQESPSRPVALKVIRDRLVSREGDRRFAREAELLAQLKHPGIAQIYSSGIAKDERGDERRFIAMELVVGKPLLAHARDAGLTRAQQIELLARVCDAVQHAHQRGVIHRDLKSANILVESSGADQIGQPKVLDFGVGRLTDEAGVERSMATEPGRIIGTLAYMSPEQLEGDPRLIDTRTDVYALGVLGYELLAGTAPLQVSEKGLTEAARIIRDVEPAPLGQVSRGCRGEVETIIARAMEKSRERRYPGAGDLAADLRRYLRHEPIQARPASASYQLRKFARRNKALVTGASIAVLALVVGLVVSTVQYSRAVRAAARSEQVARLLKNMIGGINPRIAQARDTSLLKEIVDGTAHDIGDTLKGQPEVEGELRKVIGDVYVSIGEHGPAEEQYRQALAKYDASIGRENDGAAATLIKLEAVLDATNRDAEAIAVSEEALAIRTRLFGAGSDEAADALSTLGAAQHRTDPQAGMTNLGKAVEIYERIKGPDSLDVARTLEHLGQVQVESGHGDLAEASLKRSFEIRSRVLGLDNFDTVNVGGLLGDAYLTKQQYAKAEPYCRIYAKQMAKLMPPTHAGVALAWSSLAHALHRQGKLGESITLYRAQVEPLTRMQGRDDLNVGTLHNNLGAVLTDAGEFDEAEVEYTEALRVYKASGAGENLRMPFSILGLANVAWGRGDVAASERMAREAYEMAGRTLPPKHPGILNASLRLAACQVELAFAALPAGGGTENRTDAAARASEAATLAEAAEVSFTASLGPEHFNVWLAKARLACAHAAMAAAGANGATLAAPSCAEAEQELLSVAEELRTKPTLGTFPVRDVLGAEIAGTLVRLYRAWDVAEPGKGKQELASAASKSEALMRGELASKRAQTLREVGAAGQMK